MGPLGLPEVIVLTLILLGLGLLVMGGIALVVVLSRRRTRPPGHRQ